MIYSCFRKVFSVPFISSFFIVIYVSLLLRKVHVRIVSVGAVGSSIGHLYIIDGIHTDIHKYITHQQLPYNTDREMVSARAADSSIGLKNNCTQVDMKVHCTQTIQRGCQQGQLIAQLAQRTLHWEDPPHSSHYWLPQSPARQIGAHPFLNSRIVPSSAFVVHTNDRLILCSSIRRHIFEKYSWQVTVCTDDHLTRNQIRDIMYPTLSIKGTARGLIRARSDFCITAVFRLIVPLTAYELLSEPAIWSEHVCQSRSGN